MTDLKELQSKIAELEGRLDAANRSIRASEIVLFKEREQAEVTVRNLLTEREATKNSLKHLKTIETELDAIKRSKSWRFTMPMRVIGRLCRGQWRDVFNRIKTMFSR